MVSRFGVGESDRHLRVPPERHAIGTYGALTDGTASAHERCESWQSSCLVLVKPARRDGSTPKRVHPGPVRNRLGYLRAVFGEQVLQRTDSHLFRGSILGAEQSIEQVEHGVVGRRNGIGDFSVRPVPLHRSEALLANLAAAQPRVQPEGRNQLRVVVAHTAILPEAERHFAPG